MEKDFETLLDEFASEARKKLVTFRDNGLESTKEATKVINDYSKKNPWVVVGAMAFFAAIIGFILGRKSKS